VAEDATDVVLVVSSDASQPVNLWRAASGGALAPEPPRATRVQPESILTVALVKSTFFLDCFQVEPALSGEQSRSCG